MTEVDLKRIDDAIKNDPFVQHYKKWQEALLKLRESGYRAEQQAFAVHNLNHVISTYLPEKLENTAAFLP
jgi:DNA topoisomerase VI subunit A